MTVSNDLIERLRHHADDKANTAFARSTMRELLQVLTAQPAPQKLEKPVSIGGIRFHVGVDVSHVLRAAERRYEYEQSPEYKTQQAERVAQLMSDSPITASQAPQRVAVPDFIVKRIEREIESAKNPKGMGVHDGMARVHYTDLIRLLVAAQQPAPDGEAAHPFVVKHYIGDDRPSIKGNGFDGLQVGSEREEAEEFIAWINARLRPAPDARLVEALDKIKQAHRFNVAAMAPNEVHAIAFEALAAAGKDAKP